MRKFSLLLLSLFALSTIHAQEFYSRDVVFIQAKQNTIVVQSTGEHEKKKEALAMAVKSAIDTYLFAGIAGVEDGKPLLDESARNTNITYFNRLYADGRYNVFVKNVVELEKPQKQPSKLYRTKVSVEFFPQALYKDLLNSKVLKPSAADVSLKETQEMISMPSIMVVPYKKDGQTYKSVLAGDFDKRMAVGKVQDEFRSKGVETVDLEAKLDATLRSLEFESDMADSFDTQLIKNSGADVYVTVDLIKDITSVGSRVALSLKAYDTATGRVLSSKQGSSDRFRTSAIDKLCVYAVQSVAPEFLKDISEGMAKKVSSGSTMALKVSIDGTSYRSLDDEVAGTDLGISDIIRSWLRKNAVNGAFHMQGKTSTAIIFDEVKIPNKNADGDLQDATDFGVRLTRFLKNKGINATNRIDGSTIYISIQD